MRLWKCGFLQNSEMDANMSPHSLNNYDIKPIIVGPAMNLILNHIFMSLAWQTWLDGHRCPWTSQR